MVNSSAMALGERWLTSIYRRQVCEHARENGVRFVWTFAERDAEVYISCENTLTSMGDTRTFTLMMPGGYGTTFSAAAGVVAARCTTTE